MQEETVNISNQLKYDDALTKVGGGSRYQKQLFLNLGSQWIFMALVFMNATFWLQTPSFICSNGKVCSEDKAIEQNRCSKQYLYTEYKGSQKYTSITVDLGLYCEDASYLVWAQSILYIGAAMGSFIIPQISDHIGRKVPVVGLQFITGIAVLVLSFVNSFALFMIIYFIIGFCMWPVETIIYVLINESMNGKFRERSMIGCMVLWAVGEVIIAGIAYGIPDWRDGMLYCISIPYILYILPNFFFVFESPMFFLQKNKQKCVEILNKIARFNSKPEIDSSITIIPDDETSDPNVKNLDTLPEQKTETNNQSQNISVSVVSVPNSENQLNNNQLNNNLITANAQQGNEKIYTLLDIFRYASIRKDVITCSLVNGGLCLIYFGTALSLGSLSSDIYIAMLVIGICEAISNLACAYFVHLFPRKKAIILFYGITTVLCVSFVFFGKQYDEKGQELEVSSFVSVLQLILSGLGRVTNIFSMAVYSLYCQEIFPTPVRSMASGFTYAFSTLISFIGPFCISLAYYINVYPTFILGLSGGLFLIAAFFFSETKDQPSKQYIVEEQQQKEQQQKNNQ